jgi:hypothetical protein
MVPLQVWLVTAIRQHSPVVQVMNTRWAWPIAERLHFLGLCMLVGSIGAFDLRLLGIAKRIPLKALHRFIPYGLLGFAINASTGLLFILTEPDQYIFNRSFHWKLLFLMIGAANAALFYMTSWRLVFETRSTLQIPKRARVIAAISLSSWIAVMVCGRLLTFFRPVPCITSEAAFISACTPRGTHK